MVSLVNSQLEQNHRRQRDEPRGHLHHANLFCITKIVPGRSGRDFDGMPDAPSRAFYGGGRVTRQLDGPRDGVPATWKGLRQGNARFCRLQLPLFNFVSRDIQGVSDNMAHYNVAQRSRKRCRDLDLTVDEAGAGPEKNETLVLNELERRRKRIHHHGERESLFAEAQPPQWRSSDFIWCRKREPSHLHWVRGRLRRSGPQLYHMEDAISRATCSSRLRVRCVDPALAGIANVATRERREHQTRPRLRVSKVLE